MVGWNRHYHLIASSWLAWVLSGLLVALLIFAMLALQGVEPQPEDQVTVRRVDVALPPPPPPPPPPPIQVPKTDAFESTPSINVAGLGSGPGLRYSDMPELVMDNLNRVDMPKFDVNSLNMAQTLSVDFPVLEVKNLDSIPRAVSSGSVRYPRSLSKRGIVNVETTVELIIDTRGKAYIKKIVDPVYPEMIEPIRQWVAGVQFTKPTKNGQAVQAVYLYSLVFHYRI